MSYQEKKILNISWGPYIHDFTNTQHSYKHLYLGCQHILVHPVKNHPFHFFINK